VEYALESSKLLEERKGGKLWYQLHASALIRAGTSTTPTAVSSADLIKVHIAQETVDECLKAQVSYW